MVAHFTSTVLASRREPVTKRNDLVLGISRVINRDQLLEVCYGNVFKMFMDKIVIESP